MLDCFFVFTFDLLFGAGFDLALRLAPRYVLHWFCFVQQTCFSVLVPMFSDAMGLFWSRFLAVLRSVHYPYLS